MKKCTLYFMSFLWLLGACNDPYKDTTFTAYEEVPAATYLKENPDQFSRWSELITHAGLFHTLDLNTTYTLFVPNNEAVDSYLSARGLGAVTELEVEEAAYLIRYHMLAGISFDQSQFQNGTVPRSTLTDDDLSIEFRDGGLGAIYLNGEARFVSMDIEVINGIIHEIDAVLIPVTATVADRLAESRYTVFYEAIKAAGYQEQLETIYQYDTTDNIISSRRFKFTAFAVTDSVYALSGVNSLNDLANQLGVEGTDYTNEDNKLYQYVSYHLLGTLKSSADLAEFPAGESSTNINTLATNQILSLSSIEGELILNFDELAGEGVLLDKENIACRNGVIHEVSDLMPIYTPPPVTVIWDLADQSDIAALCSSYQKSDLTSSYYQRVFVEDELTSYTWKSSPEGRSGVVIYRNNRSNDGVFYSTLNWDHMRFQTGASGWVEATTPVLIKGTYKITLSYVSPLATSNSGIMIASMDGRQLGGQLVTSNTSQDQIRSHVLTEDFVFSETQSHQFRIVGVDGKLLTLDYLKFEPVD